MNVAPRWCLLPDPQVESDLCITGMPACRLWPPPESAQFHRVCLSVDKQGLGGLGHLPVRSNDALARQLRSRNPIRQCLSAHTKLHERPRDSHGARQANRKRRMLSGGAVVNQALPRLPQQKSPRRGGLAGVRHFQTRPRHAPAPSRMLASVKAVGRTGRNAAERRRGVPIGTGRILKGGGPMGWDEERRVARGEDALSMRREMDRQTNARSIAGQSDEGITYGRVPGLARSAQGNAEGRNAPSLVGNDEQKILLDGGLAQGGMAKRRRRKKQGGRRRGGRERGAEKVESKRSRRRGGRGYIYGHAVMEGHGRGSGRMAATAPYPIGMPPFPVGATAYSRLHYYYYYRHTR
ncbi:hypothetical protein Purlil1_13025 [Purpureocillium lilacinum]|uniref:Uncharacterized protein n=1 Tax=Purpureocillium lilacinum TaxID=33203 RepID=A0ABR0BF80_PURLI|nr:hypothetical protein Purlil1_13025 [Purpureocillium lilacinum]